MSSLTFKPSRSPATILATPRRRWSQRELDDLAESVCKAWLTPDIGLGKSQDPANSKLFLLVVDALGKVNGDT